VRDIDCGQDSRTICYAFVLEAPGASINTKSASGGAARPC
jgi:hypothetical protein